MGQACDLGTLELPADFLPIAVREDRVYRISTDSLDVEHVVVLEISG